jgi:hypothetical protein
MYAMEIGLNVLELDNVDTRLAEGIEADRMGCIALGCSLPRSYVAQSSEA